MFEWECPHCHRKFYSSCPDREIETIECCYCNEKLDNPYYCEEEVSHD